MKYLLLLATLQAYLLSSNCRIATVNAVNLPSNGGGYVLSKLSDRSQMVDGLPSNFALHARSRRAAAAIDVRLAFTNQRNQNETQQPPSDSQDHTVNASHLELSHSGVPLFGSVSIVAESQSADSELLISVCHVNVALDDWLTTEESLAAALDVERNTGIEIQNTETGIAMSNRASLQQYELLIRTVTYTSTAAISTRHFALQCTVVYGKDSPNEWEFDTNRLLVKVQAIGQHDDAPRQNEKLPKARSRQPQSKVQDSAQVAVSPSNVQERSYTWLAPFVLFVLVALVCVALFIVARRRRSATNSGFDLASSRRQGNSRLDSICLSLGLRRAKSKFGAFADRIRFGFNSPTYTDAAQLVDSETLEVEIDQDTLQPLRAPNQQLV